MAIKPIYVQAGDTFFTRSNSLLGMAIRLAERDPGEEAVWANHTGVVVESGWIGGNTFPQAVVVEALWKTRKGPLKVNGIEVRVFGPAGKLSAKELALFRSEADKYVGDTYGWWKLGFHLIDRLAFKGKKVVSRLLFLDKRPICSYLAAKVNASVDLFFGMLPEVATPDEMVDFCETNPDYWVERV